MFVKLEFCVAAVLLFSLLAWDMLSLWDFFVVLFYPHYHIQGVILMRTKHLNH